MGDNEKWWLDGLTDEQRSALEHPVPLPLSYQPYAQSYPYQPPATKKLAGWALGLSFVPCFCLTQIVAVALAIIALVRSRDGRDHGKGLAIAALCVVGVWFIGLSAWVAIETVDEIRHGDTGDTSDGSQIAVRNLQAGDCFDLPEGDTARSVQGVPCDELHDAEIFWTFELPAGEFPGETAVEAAARRGCVPAFDEFVGTPYDDSELEVAYFFPSGDFWRLGERDVSCAVYEPTRPVSDDVNRVGGTLRNARR